MRGIGMALLAFAIFATHDVVVKVLGGSYAPFQMLFFATLFSFPLVTLMLMRDPTHGNLRPVHPWWTLLRTSCAVINALCAFYAFSTLPLAQVYAILFASPLLITVLAIPILGERVGLHRGLAVLAGLVGVIVVLRPGGQELELGHFAAITSSIMGATASVITRKIGRDERSVVLMLYPMVASFILMAVLMTQVYEPMPLRDLGLVGVLSVMGFIAGLLLIGAYKASEAAIVAPMQYSQIIWATLYGFFLFGETLDVPTIAGTGIIVASGLYIVFRESRGGHSSNTPVLRTRTRPHTASNLLVASFLRRANERR